MKGLEQFIGDGAIGWIDIQVFGDCRNIDNLARRITLLVVTSAPVDGSRGEGDLNDFPIYGIIRLAFQKMEFQFAFFYKTETLKNGTER